MIEATLTVNNKLGLHARAAAQLVRTANRFHSKMHLERLDGGAAADAKSILSVLTLAANGGTQLRAVAEGADEQAAMTALAALFTNGFGENQAEATTKVSPALAEMHWQGLSVSQGFVVGRVLRMHDGAQHVYAGRVEAADVGREVARFREAARGARKELQAVKARAEQLLGMDRAYIFDAHLLLLEDRKLRKQIESYITTQHCNAEWAVKVAADRLLAVYSEIKDDYLRERGSDIEDVTHRILVALSGERPRPLGLSKDAVIVAEDLLPSVVAELDLQHARAIATDGGGWTSHTAIIARGLGIPAIVGLGNLYQQARTGDEIIIDSYNGEVILHPTTDTIEKRKAESHKLEAPRTVEPAKDRLALHTTDGVTITLRANVELPAEFDGVKRYGAQGIGLYRSEFLLARPGVMFSEDDQYEAYSEVARLAGANGAKVRLFDLGGDKSGDAVAESERNPALGLRAIRFGLRNEPVIRTQVRAIMRAAANGLLDIVLPMVGDVGDVLRAKQIIAEEKSKMERDGISVGDCSIGAMIEVPSAVLTADKIAQCVDFFELGTNDLVQYVLAVDRGNDKVAEWFRTLHPAVLESISRTLKAAQSANIPAIVCGEMASTPVYAVLLVGLGATELSMTPSSIPRVTRALAGIDSRTATSIADECLQGQTADEVESLVRDRFLSHWPHLFSPRTLPAAKGPTMRPQEPPTKILATQD
jgi:phosphoenolpyruvate-protein phosphotransferase